MTRLWLLSGCDQCWRLSITCGSDLDWKGGALKNNWLLLAAKYFASLYRLCGSNALQKEPLVFAAKRCQQWHEFN